VAADGFPEDLRAAFVDGYAASFQRAQARCRGLSNVYVRVQSILYYAIDRPEPFVG